MAQKMAAAASSFFLGRHGDPSSPVPILPRIGRRRTDRNSLSSDGPNVDIYLSTSNQVRRISLFASNRIGSPIIIHHPSDCVIFIVHKERVSYGNFDDYTTQQPQPQRRVTTATATATATAVTAG